MLLAFFLHIAIHIHPSRYLCANRHSLANNVKGQVGRWKKDAKLRRIIVDVQQIVLSDYMYFHLTLIVRLNYPQTADVYLWE